MLRAAAVALKFGLNAAVTNSFIRPVLKKLQFLDQ
jgi:hypothetical protein